MKKNIIILIVLMLSIISFAKVYVYNNEVVFEYKDITASKVFLAGSFNNWDPSALPMKKMNGIWKVSMKLAPGDYQYKFVVNGTDWKEDPEAPDYVPDGYGGKNGTFTLILENGVLKIKKPEKQKSGILSGTYSFDLKSKVDIDTYSLKTPEISQKFNLIITPNKSGMNFEAVLNADNSNWQFGLESLKVIWENSDFEFGIYKNKASNELINFNENIEENNSGFFGVYKSKFIDVGIDLISINNNLNYYVSSRVLFNNSYFNVLFTPETKYSSMSIYSRLEVNGIGLEGKYTDKLEYIVSDFNNENISIKGVYNFINKDISLTGNYNNIFLISGNYNISNNIYDIESNLNLSISEKSKVLLDLYYDNLNNIGYRIGYGLIKDDISLIFKLGHDFENDFENFYFYINSSSKF
ncbi:isoamylase early set domain-containing protein [Marinitoga litoralis]|uniref:isoamylase early set domain-containing protein n=1 Tax=Marinitoga litoralis TaxID=570855 RepID=UPI001960C294|nr:isoamylase early set domain-containing protein [Marinitoga litoralis]MBM7559517.1 hypothetical protein [Marinitoga litoralis]